MVRHNGKSRHISLRHEYVRSLIDNGSIMIIYVKSSNSLADPFTKGLPREMVEKTSKEMGRKPLNIWSPVTGTQPIARK